MATHTEKRASHFSTSTGDTITFTDCRSVTITNRSTTVNCSFTIDGSTPTDLGAESYVVTPGTTKIVEVAGPVTIKTVAPSACAISIEAF